MKLSRQLLLASLMVLIVPLAGIRSVQEIELIWREQQVQVVNASLRAAAASLALRNMLPQPVKAEGAIYVQALGSHLVADGYMDDWASNNLVPRHLRLVNPHPIDVSYTAATDNSSLFLTFSIKKSSPVVYYNPVKATLKNGDRIVLAIAGNPYTIVTEAPGRVVARTFNTWNGIERVVRENRIRGHWRDTSDGYQLELKLPLDMVAGTLGFTVVSGHSGVQLSSFDPVTGPGALILPSPSLLKTLKAFLEPDMRLGMIDSAGWQIAETGSRSQPQHSKEDEPFWLIGWFYQMILDWSSLPEYQPHWRDGGWQRSKLASVLEGQPVSVWQREGGEYRLLTSWPLEQDGEVVGALIAEQGSQAVLSLVSRSFNRLFSASFLAIVLVAAGLLGYASWLSLRISRLNRATEQCLGRDGRFNTSFPASPARDELGELSRSIAAMLNRLEEHTDYLRSLGSKLSHELRTPLAVVRSSLENLEHEHEHEQVDKKAQVYVSRALAGADRLGILLNSISEATRLETLFASVADSGERESVDLVQMLTDLTQAYSGVYEGSRFVARLPDSTCPVSIFPELVVQAMDKLVSNAVDFCPATGVITLGLRQQGGTILVTVENDGPLLPESMEGRLFDSMVSVRKVRGEKPHLGLGLYIVRLVMECHGGRACAMNREDNSGVVFSLTFQEPDQWFNSR